MDISQTRQKIQLENKVEIIYSSVNKNKATTDKNILVRKVIVMIFPTIMTLLHPWTPWIMSFIYNSLSPYPQGCKNVTSVQCLIWQLRFFDLLKSMIYELKRSVGLGDGCLNPLLHSSLDHLVQKLLDPLTLNYQVAIVFDGLFEERAI